MYHELLATAWKRVKPFKMTIERQHPNTRTPDRTCMFTPCWGAKINCVVKCARLMRQVDNNHEVIIGKNCVDRVFNISSLKNHLDRSKILKLI